VPGASAVWVAAEFAGQTMITGGWSLRRASRSSFETRRAAAKNARPPRKRTQCTAVRSAKGFMACAVCRISPEARRCQATSESDSWQYAELTAGCSSLQAVCGAEPVEDKPMVGPTGVEKTCLPRAVAHRQDARLVAVRKRPLLGDVDTSMEGTPPKLKGHHLDDGLSRYWIM
jgi:hypothetical protein